MDESNMILNMPFDESAGSTVAYDYSSSGVNGQVDGAQFVPGVDGNAIRFTGNDSCKVSQRVLPMEGDFSILMRVQGARFVAGADRLIWQLNFTGDNNYFEVRIDVGAGAWHSLALTRASSRFRFFVNGLLVDTVNKTDVLQGISLNQDFYATPYGAGMLDDVKFYSVALTQDELALELLKKKQPSYFIDGVNFRDYGVVVSASKGVVGRPKLKKAESAVWDDYPGETVDLSRKYYEAREIVLSCSMVADGKSGFIERMLEFVKLFDAGGLQRFVIDVHRTKPLVYGVYCADAVSVTKKWHEELMTGTFELKLIEPEPLKRVLKFSSNGTSVKRCSITMTSSKLVNIYWGDGASDFDIAGDGITVNHDYAGAGDFFIIVSGCIDEIAMFNTNATVVWNRL